MKTCIIILLLGINFPGLSQSRTELQLLHQHAGHKQHTPAAELDDAGIPGIAGSVFNIYKTFISSQDHMSCVFSPSCSEYALQAVQQQGFLLGMINTFDRLTRCNGLRPGDYQVDPHLHRLFDPVRNISYEAL